MKLYRFLTGPDDANFCHKVTAALNNGWMLYGSPTYVLNTALGVMQCGQAVIKEIDGIEYTENMKLSQY